MLEQARKILKKYYGYEAFRPGQAKVIESLLQGRDSLAIMPTGAGKSLCFQVPALLLPGVTLVVSPLISLMKDQVDGLNSQGVPSTFINSSLANSAIYQRLNGIAAGQYKLVYVAPERLETEAFQHMLQQLTVSMVAVDEAHCVSQWGHDFRPSYQVVSAFIQGLKVRPVIGAFTATATPEVKEDIVGLLSLKQPQVFVSGFDRPNLSFQVLRGEDKKQFVVNYVEARRKESGIIYAATRREVDELHALLRKKGLAAGRYHAGLSDQERIREQDAFLYDEIQVMAATNAFGMGIDKSNVRYVLHYNMPKNMEAYYQEAGRSGRDGEPGECILLFSQQDVLLQKFLIDKSVEHPRRKQHELAKLQNMVEYCYTPDCLRSYILRYFGEMALTEPCDNCGNCNDDREAADITIDAQKVFSCIYRMKERFGIALIAEVLKGSKNKKVLQFNLEELPTYGLFRQHTLDEIKTLIQRLIATEYLTLTEGQYPLVKLTPLAFAVMRGNAQVWQKTFVQRTATADDTLFERLRALRKELAAAEQVPPYVVFADSVLKEMSQYYPQTEAAMGRIKGVGDLKRQKYGQAFMTVISQYVAEHPQKISPLPALEVDEPDKPQASKPNKPDKEESHVITLKLFQQGAALPDIAQSRALTLQTVQNHLARAAEEGHVVDWDRIIPAQYEQLILAKIRELGRDKLKPIKEALPQEIEYGEIKAVMCKHFA